MESPKIDKRSPEDLMGEIRSLIPFYTPEWKPSKDDSGIALAEIFTSMLGTVIHRLNQVPQKNFTAFLEMLGMKLLPPQPAIAPITFSLSKGTKEHVFIREGAQMAAEDILFETEKSMLATPSRLIKVYGIDKEGDAIYESPTNIVAGEPALPFQTRLLHGSGEGDKEIFIKSSEGVSEGDLLAIRNKANEEYGIVSEVSDHLVKLLHKLEHGHASNTLVEKVTTFELFGGKDLQEHILYLGHTDLFNVKAAAEFTLTLSPWGDRIADEGLVIWQYWGERLDGETKVLDWYDLDVTDGKLILTKSNTDEIKEREVSGIESRWIRCVANASRISELHDVKIDTIEVESLVKGDLFPDMAFYNDVPLEIPKNGSPIHPFGTRPRELDTFYMGSQDAFSKKGAEITIKFIISGADVVDNETPVIRVHGVGTEFESRLNDAKIYTIGQLTRHTKEELTEILKEGGTKPQSYYSTKAINVLEAAKKGFYDKSDSSGTGNDANISSAIGNQELILSWEYWDGKGWTAIDGLNGFEDDSLTNGYDFKFLKTGWVKFTCPEGIGAVKVSGQENYWIRVRIISGDYGKEMVYANGAWVPGTINPPKISTITLSYELNTPVNPEHCLTYNNLNFKDVSEESHRENKTFAPFQPLDDEHRTLYLGFDKKHA